MWAVLDVSFLSATLHTPISALPNFAHALRVAPPHLTSVLTFNQRAKCLSRGIPFPFIQLNREIIKLLQYTQPCREVKINTRLTRSLVVVSQQM